ncbi:YDG domain-containing protein [Caniella muris]|uniref:YDG domain-containing protein n=1 Tax=Caniella muris TaxID=2941502 RepID=UPI00203FE5EC|nr:YDG domain-containing protein [Caniella muris]
MDSTRRRWLSFLVSALMAVSMVLQPVSRAWAAEAAVRAGADSQPTLTIVAGAATPVSPGSTTYTFPHLTVTNSDPTRDIKSITVQFTSAITDKDAITLTADEANGFVTLATNKRGNQSANNDAGASAEEWSRYLREHLTITLGDSVTTKSLRMIANFDPVQSLYDYNSANGHYYETVKASGASWEAAFKAASAKKYMGMQGYLVTITSQQEHDYVYTMIGENCWMGSTCLDAYTGPVKDTYKDFYAEHGINIPASTMPGNAYYFWVCGPEAGKLVTYGLTTPHAAPDPVPDPSNNYSPTIYTNWASGEPNNANGEQCMHFYTSQQGRWNDFSNTNASCTAYVIEYGGMEGDDDSGVGDGDGDGDVDVDVFVKVDIDVDPSGKTITTEAYDIFYGSPVDIRDNVNGDTNITTTDVASGTAAPAEVTHTYAVYDPDSDAAGSDGYRPALPTELDRDGNPYAVGRYKVLTHAVYAVQPDGDKTPYVTKEASFQIKPLPMSVTPADPEVGKPLEFEEGDTVPVYNPETGELEDRPVDRTYYERDPEKDPSDPDAWVPVPPSKLDPETGEPIHAGDYKVEVAPPDGAEGIFEPVETEFTIDPKEIDLSDLVVDEPFDPDPSVSDTDDATNPADVPFIYKKVYDGTTDYDTSKVNVAGFVLPGSGVSVTCDGGEFDSAAVGATRTIELTGVELTGTWAGDYTIKGLADGTVSVPAVIVPRRLVVTPRSSVVVGKAGEPLVDGLKRPVAYSSNEDVHDSADLPWTENMLAPVDANRLGSSLDSILGDATYTCRRDSDGLELDPDDPAAGVYTLKVYFSNLGAAPEAAAAQDPAADGAPEEAAPEGPAADDAASDQTAPLDGEVLDGDALDEEVLAPAPVPVETAVAAAGDVAATVVGASGAADSDDSADAADDPADTDADTAEGAVVSQAAFEGKGTFSFAPLYRGGAATRLASWTPEQAQRALANYTVEVREAKVIVSADPSDPDEQQKIKEELEKQGAAILEGTYNRVADKDAEPVGPGTLSDLLDRTFPGTLPGGTTPSILIVKDGETVPSIDPTTPGTYTVVATYQPSDPTQPPTVVNLTYTVEKPAPRHEVVSDETGTLPEGPGPFGPDVFVDLVEREHGDKVPEDAERTVTITRDGETVDAVDPSVPGTYVVEVTYTDPDGNETVFRTTIVVPEPERPGPQGSTVIEGNPSIDLGSGPVTKDDIEAILADRYGSRLPDGVRPTIRILLNGSEVDAIDPAVPGTYEVVAVYQRPDGSTVTVRFTVTVGSGTEGSATLPTTGGARGAVPATGDVPSLVGAAGPAAVAAAALTAWVARRRR